MSAFCSSTTSYEHSLYYKTASTTPTKYIIHNTDTFEYASKIPEYRIILQKISKINWKGFVIIPINHFVSEAGYDFYEINPSIDLSYSHKNVFGFDYNFLTEDTVCPEDIYQDCENLISWFDKLSS